MSDKLSAEERTAIDQAIAAGRVEVVPPMMGCGLSWIERTTGVTAWAGMGKGTTPWRVAKGS